MLTIFLRTLIIFITVFIVIRLMGKRQIGEMQPFELVVTLIIADLACIPMADASTPLIYGIVAMLCVFLLHQAITFINRKSLKVRKIFSGKPIIVMTPDGIDYKELEKLNMSMADLVEAVRNSGCFYLEDVDYAIFETNGKISVLQKKENQTESQTLPTSVVSEGKIIPEGLEKLQIDEKFICGILRQKSTKLKDVIYLSIDEDGSCYLQDRTKQKYETFDVELKGSANE